MMHEYVIYSKVSVINYWRGPQGWQLRFSRSLRNHDFLYHSHFELLYELSFAFEHTTFAFYSFPFKLASFILSAFNTFSKGFRYQSSSSFALLGSSYHLGAALHTFVYTD
jgi:hypothetical protein